MRSRDEQFYVKLYDEAKNGNTSSEKLTAILEGKADSYDPVRRNALVTTVLSNRNVPERYLVENSKNNKASIRSAVAGNPSTPQNVLTELCDDENAYVHVALANNPSTPIHVLEKLAGVDDVTVLQMLVINQNVSSEILDDAYKKCLNVDFWLEKVSDRNDRRYMRGQLRIVRRFAVQHVNVTVDTLTYAALNEDEQDVLSEVYENKKTPGWVKDLIFLSDKTG